MSDCRTLWQSGWSIREKRTRRPVLKGIHAGLDNRGIIGLSPEPTFLALRPAIEGRRERRTWEARGVVLEGLVETGEGRTPRPEGPMYGSTTSLFGALCLTRCGFRRRNPLLASRCVFRRLLSTWRRLHPGLLAPASPLPGIEVSGRSRL